jgi:hypothetical protein
MSGKYLQNDTFKNCWRLVSLVAPLWEPTNLKLFVLLVLVLLTDFLWIAFSHLVIIPSAWTKEAVVKGDRFFFSQQLRFHPVSISRQCYRTKLHSPAITNNRQVFYRKRSLNFAFGVTRETNAECALITVNQLVFVMNKQCVYSEL